MRVAFFFILMLLFTSCGRDLSTNAYDVTAQPAVGYVYIIEPISGSPSTQFKIAACPSGGMMTTHEPLYEYKITYTDQGKDFSTEWHRLGEAFNISCQTPGKHYIQFLMKGKSNAFYTATDSLYIQNE